VSEGWLMTHRAMLAVGARGLNIGITRAIHAAIARTALATLCMEPLLALSRLALSRHVAGALGLHRCIARAVLAASTFGLCHWGIVCATVLAGGALAFNF